MPRERSGLLVDEGSQPVEVTVVEKGEYDAGLEQKLKEKVEEVVEHAREDRLRRPEVAVEELPAQLPPSLSGMAIGTLPALLLVLAVSTLR